MRREKSYRGISHRLAVQYLETLGGEHVEENEIAGDDWYASLSTDTVAISAAMTLTEITVVFEGDDDTLCQLIERFDRKAMRAGG